MDIKDVDLRKLSSKFEYGKIVEIVEGNSDIIKQIGEKEKQERMKLYNIIMKAYSRESSLKAAEDLFEDAIKYRLKAIEIGKQIVENFPDDHNLSTTLLANYVTIGSLYVDEKNYEKAEEYLLKGMNVYSEYCEKDSKTVKLNIANIYNALGDVYSAKGDDCAKENPDMSKELREKARDSYFNEINILDNLQAETGKDYKYRISETLFKIHELNKLTSKNRGAWIACAESVFKPLHDLKETETQEKTPEDNSKFSPNKDDGEEIGG